MSTASHCVIHPRVSGQHDEDGPGGAAAERKAAVCVKLDGEAAAWWAWHQTLHPRLPPRLRPLLLARRWPSSFNCTPCPQIMLVCALRPRVLWGRMRYGRTIQCPISVLPLQLLRHVLLATRIFSIRCAVPNVCGFHTGLLSQAATGGSHQS